MYFFKCFSVAVLGVALSAGTAAADNHNDGKKTHSNTAGPVHSAQQALKDAGYYEGSVDGIAGPMTREAVRKYQEQEGLQVTGRLDRATLERLRRDHESAFQGEAEAAAQTVREGVRQGERETSRAREEVREAGRESERTLEDARQPVREGRREAERTVKDARQPVREAREEGERIVDRAEEPVSEARDEAGRLTDRAKEGVKEAGGTVGEALREAKGVVTGRTPEKKPSTQEADRKSNNKKK